MKEIARHPQTTLKKIYISSKKVNLSTPLKFETNLKILRIFSVLFQIFLPLGKKYMKYIFQKLKMLRSSPIWVAECPDMPLYKRFSPIII